MQLRNSRIGLSLQTLIGLFIAASSPAQAVVQAELKWSLYPGFYRPGGAGVEILDLDGNGQPVAVVTGSLYDIVAHSEHRALAVLAHGPDGYRVRHVRELEPGEVFRGRIRASHAGDGHPAAIHVVLNRDGQSSLVRFEGPGLRRGVEIPVTSNFMLAGVADLAATGELHAFGHSGGPSPWDRTGRLQIIDLATGALEWTSDFDVHQIIAAQLDDDPALELVVSTSQYDEEMPGYVIDGATKLTEWTHAPGFNYASLLPGNFSVGVTTPGFAVVPGCCSTRIFGTAAGYGLASSFPTGTVFRAAAQDIDGDGVSEIIVSDATRIRIFNAGGDLLRTVSGSRHGMGDIAAGSLAGVSGSVLVFGYGSSGPDTLAVIEAASGEERFALAAQFGPHSTVLVADLDRDGRPELVRMPRSEAGYETPLVVVNATTGVELRHTNTMSSASTYHFGPHVLAANLDADPQLELVVGSVTGNYPQIVALDGITLEQQWALSPPSSLYDTVEAIALVPSDDVGIPTIAASIGNRPMLIDGATGTVIWQGAQFPGPKDRTLLVEDLDGDGTPELMLSAGTQVYVIELKTRLLRTILDNAEAVIGQSVERTDGHCVHVLYGSTSLSRFSCDGIHLDSRHYPEASMVRALSDSHGPLLLASGSDLVLHQAGGDSSVVASGLGAELGFRNRGVVQVEGDQVEVFVGSMQGIHRLAFNPQRVFADRFEARD